MNLKEQLLDRKDASLDDLLARFNLRRAPRGASRFALPALALAGAAAVGWLARVLRAPTAGGLQRRPSRERDSAHRGTRTKAVNKAVGKVRGLLPETSARASRRSRASARRHASSAE